MIRRPPRSTLLSLHDALPICSAPESAGGELRSLDQGPELQVRDVRLHWTETGESTEAAVRPRSEEHTSELQSQSNLVCRLLLEKKQTATLQAVCLHAARTFMS